MLLMSLATVLAFDLQVLMWCPKSLLLVITASSAKVALAKVTPGVLQLDLSFCKPYQRTKNKINELIDIINEKDDILECQEDLLIKENKKIVKLKYAYALEVENAKT
jgi:hypothetical protein